MSTLTLQRHEPAPLWPAWREHGFAFGVAVALHLGLGWVLVNLSQGTPLQPAAPTLIQTQLVSLPAAPPPAPAAPLPTPTPTEATPVEQAPAPEAAALAFKRVEQERQQRQRIEQQRLEQQQRREQQAREDQQRQLQLEQERLALARQAAAQEAAAAAARAEAEAASRQYLPIAKQAPDYPQRALDRRIEGECTVAYRVNAQGRVEAPEVVGSCHPLFVKPSLSAAKRFRYQPRIVNGQAVAVANVKNTFSYRIQ